MIICFFKNDHIKSIVFPVLVIGAWVVRDLHNGVGVEWNYIFAYFMIVLIASIFIFGLRFVIFFRISRIERTGKV